MRSRVTQHFIRTRCNSNLLSQYYRIEFAFSFVCINRHDGESTIFSSSKSQISLQIPIEDYSEVIIVFECVLLIINWVG